MALRQLDANYSRVGYVPDQFGHTSQLPQIFAGFDLLAAATMRGTPMVSHLSISVPVFLLSTVHVFRVLCSCLSSCLSLSLHVCLLTYLCLVYSALSLCLLSLSLSLPTCLSLCLSVCRPASSISLPSQCSVLSTYQDGFRSLSVLPLFLSLSRSLSLSCSLV
jgi:hypothetical protein